jgi:hypothetical protein
MRGKNAIIAVLGIAVAAAFLALVVLDSGGDSATSPKRAEIPGRPSVDFISPRNGAVQRGTAVVVKAEIENFRLAPRRFGGEPMLAEGSIRFSLNRVPDCVDPEKLRRAEESAIGKGRLVGASFDYPQYAGPNGVLGARIGSSGSYSPATRPEIFYSGLRPGFYRLVATLAANDGTTTPYHAVTSFQILEKPNHQIADCVGGKVSSAAAAAAAALD